MAWLRREYFTTTAAVGLARARGVEMPITEQMYAILHEGKDPRAAIVRVDDPQRQERDAKE